MEKKWNNLKNLIGLMLLSILIGSCFFSLVNKLIDKIAPREVVAITVQQRQEQSTGGSEAWIVQRPVGQSQALFEDYDYSGVWEYRDAQQYGYSFNMLVSYGDNVESTLIYNSPRLAGSEILIWKNANSGMLRIDTKYNSHEVDLYSENEGGELYSIFPFADDKTGFLLKSIAYVLLFGAIFGLLCLLFKLFYKGIKLPAWMGKPCDWKIFIIFFIVLYGFAVLQYRIGISNYLTMGDQLYYWHTTNYFTNGKWDMEQFANSTLSFRGYLCNFIPFISKTIGALIRIDPVYVYYIFTAASIAYLTGYVMPKLHEVMTGHKTKLYQTVIFLGVFIVFWNGMLTAVLMDLFAVTCFMGGLLYVLLYAKERKLYYAGLAGILLAGATVFRSPYQYGVMGLIVIVLAITVIKAIRKIRMHVRKKEQDWIDKISAKKIVASIVLFAVTFIAVCIPQIQINAARGHAGLLPYDAKGAWIEQDSTLAEMSANLCLTRSIIVYPYGLTDKQIMSMKNSYYSGDALLSMNQLFDMFVSNPADTTVYIGKKLFCGFDVKTNVTYPANNYEKKTSHYLFSLFNYIVLACSIYTIFTKNISKRENIIFSLAFLTIILLQTLVHVEWRYYISGYLILYYLLAFRFTQIIEDNESFKNAIKGNFLFYLAGFVYLSQWISLTFYG